MPLHWEESKQGKQGFLLKPQDEKVAVCKPTVQEDLVGSREALCETTFVDQGVEDYREEWTGCCC